MGLHFFYKYFIPHFSRIMVPITDYMNGRKFVRDNNAEKAFELVKVCLTTAPILVSSYFHQPFELHIDASKVGIGVVLR